MEFVNVVAIIRSDVLERVEKKLRAIGAPGLSVCPVRGYGEYADFYKADWLTEQVQLSIFAEAARAEELAEAVMEAAHTGMEGDGLVAVLPVTGLYHVRTRRRCTDKPC